MPGVTESRRAELVHAVCLVLRDHPNGLRARDVLAEVARQHPPSSAEEAEYAGQPGSRRYEKNIRFASINAVKAGWLVKAQGVWSLTEEGVRALESFSDPTDFYRDAKRLYREWASDRALPDEEEADTEDGSASSSAIAFEEAEEAAWSAIEAYLVAIPPYDLQELVAALLSAMGYHVEWNAPRGRDQGIDIIAYNDPIGVQGQRILVQVKRRADAMDPSEVRAFLAVLGERDVGIFVATGGFTGEAQREARTQERRRLTLIDLRRFVNLWVEHWGELDEAARQKLPLKPVHFLAPPE
jgi:restriction system protein